MTRTTAILTISLAGLFSVVVAAEEAPAGAEAKQAAEEALAKIAAKTRDALVFLEVDYPDRPSPYSFGVFISGSGLALVDIQALAGKKKPECVVAGEKFIKFGKILEVYPEQEAALMKFEHRPKAFLSLGLEEPDVGDPLAFVTLSGLDPWKADVPPAVGPVMTKRSSTTSNLREARFTRVLSLGTGLSFEQRNHLGPGCYAVNSEGQLVAFGNGFRRARGQTIITLAPVVALAGRIETARKAGTNLGFPLSEDDSHYDSAALDPDFHPLNVAVAQRDFGEAEKLLKKLLKRYPDSSILNSKRFLLEMVGVDGSPGKAGGGEFAEPAPDSGEVNPAQAEKWSMRAAALAMRNEDDSAIAAFQKAIARCPKDHPEFRASLAGFYLQRRRFEDAEAVCREIYPLMSDSIEFVEMYESVLLGLKKLDEADRMTERIYELEEVYRRP